jgi:hypothetical protein
MGGAVNIIISSLFPKYCILFRHPCDFTNKVPALSSILRTFPGPSFLWTEVLRSGVRCFTVVITMRLIMYLITLVTASVTRSTKLKTHCFGTKLEINKALYN